MKRVLYEGWRRAFTVVPWGYGKGFVIKLEHTGKHHAYSTYRDR